MERGCPQPHTPPCGRHLEGAAAAVASGWLCAWTFTVTEGATPQAWPEVRSLNEKTAGLWRGRRGFESHRCLLLALGNRANKASAFSSVKRKEKHPGVSPGCGALSKPAG